MKLRKQVSQDRKIIRWKRAVNIVYDVWILRSSHFIFFPFPHTKVRVRARFLFTIYNISCCVTVTMNFHYFFCVLSCCLYLSVNETENYQKCGAKCKRKGKKPHRLFIYNADIWSICSSARIPTTQFKIVHASCDYCRVCFVCLFGCLADRWSCVM